MGKICDVDPVMCNNDTHFTEEDPEDPCCMLCKPRMKPCEKQVVETKMLNFTQAPYGFCVSPPLEVSSCVGSCGFSESGGSHFEWKHRNEALPLFDLDSSPPASVARLNLLPARLNSSVTTKRRSPSVSHRSLPASVSSVLKKYLDLHWHREMRRLPIINASTVQILQLNKTIKETK